MLSGGYDIEDVVASFQVVVNSRSIAARTTTDWATTSDGSGHGGHSAVLREDETEMVMIPLSGHGEEENGQSWDEQDV